VSREHVGHEVHDPSRPNRIVAADEPDPVDKGDGDASVVTAVEPPTMNERTVIGAKAKAAIIETARKAIPIDEHNGGLRRRS